MGLLEQKLLGWIATRSVKNSAGSLKILRVQNVMSWRSAGSWTRCTRSNAFPGVDHLDMAKNVEISVEYEVISLFFNDAVKCILGHIQDL